MTIKSLRDYINLIETAQQGIAEATGDPKFDKMLKGITGKRQVAKQQKADTKQQARDAFGGMFGGGNPADKLSIRKKGVLKDDNSEVTDISDSDYMRIKGIVDKKYPGYELSSLNIGRDGYIEIEIYNYKTHDTKNLKTKSTSENKQGVAEGKK